MPTITQTSVLERFLRYVQIDTQSAAGSDTYPSTLKQLVLLDLLKDELHTLGLTDATRDPYGYVFATLPGTSPKLNVPVIGLIAHVDTAADASGTDVKPIVHRNWAGQDLMLPDNPAMVLGLKNIPALERQRGNEIGRAHV